MPHFFKAALHHVIRRLPPPKDKALCHQPLTQDQHHKPLYPWHKKQKTQKAGQKARNNQQDRGDHRQTKPSHLHHGIAPWPTNPATPPQDRHAKEGRSQHKADRQPQTQGRPQGYEKPDLDQRPNQKQRNRLHHRPQIRGKLDLRRTSPYIGMQRPIHQPIGPI